ncbi:MmgE/PrpD family protein [Chloroflexota bacterium]
MNETRQLVKFVAETTFGDLPPGLVEEFRITVLDTIAAALVGSAQPWARMVLEMVHQLGGKPEASIIGQPAKTDISRAALANGTLIGSFEAEPLTGSHASGTVIPAALAVAQREHLDGRAFITALATGYEVQGRIARTAVGLELERGFHNPGTQGPFGVAMAVGKLMGFDEATLVNSMGIAGSCSAGLLEFAWEGANTKRIHLGRASQLGLESALLAHKGFTGPSTVLEGRYGYYNAFSMPTSLERLLEGLGETWVIRPSSHKSYATHVTHQAVVHAIREFKQKHPFDPKTITRVVIKGPHRIMEERHADRVPSSVMGGQYSLPFTTSVALTRDMADPLVYNDEAVWDPVVRDLALRIDLVPDEGASHGAMGSAEITLEFDGQRHVLQAKPHKGSPMNPFTWEEICEKFRRFTARVISEPQAFAIIEAVGSLPDTQDMATVAETTAST